MMLLRQLICAFGLALAIAPAAFAEEAGPPLPTTKPCGKKERPLLPEKWRGLYLMAPFARAQLTLADIVYDDSLNAMRVRLYGLKGGSADFLVKGKETYLLGKDGAKSCEAMGDTGLRPLPRDLLGREAECEGSAAIGGVMLDWWKTPSSSPPSANWAWYSDGGSPFRLMVTQPDGRLSILGWYSFTYRARFEALPETGLNPIVASCQATPSHDGRGRKRLQTLIADMERAQPRAENAIAALMPEVKAGCGRAPLPGWADQAAMGAFMTPPAFKDSPLPAEVLYDGGRKVMLTRMSYPAGAKLSTEEALLLDGYGYSILRTRESRPSCDNSLPGTVRPNWTTTGGCSCEASVEGGTPLTPYGTARILVCPMTAPRVVWAWFAADGRPQVFMETSAPGDDPTTVLALVDYTAWMPGKEAPRAAFAAPSQCRAPRAPVAQPASRHAMQGASRSCGACHLDRIAGR